MAVTKPPDDTPLSRQSAARAVADEVCGYLERTQTENVELLCQFAREFMGKAPRTLAREQPLEELASLLVGAFRFLERSRPDRVNAEVIDPASEGWPAPVTVMRVELGDRPFIVDSIREYLAIEKLTIRRFIHPILGVARDAHGRVTAVGDADVGPMEAFVHCELSPVADEARRTELRAGVEERLEDVRAATDDFERMVAAVDETMRIVESYEDRFPTRARESREAAEFLRWLVDGNFVFLGYRAYDLSGEGDAAALEVAHGSGMGILRRDEESTWAKRMPIRDLPESLRRRVTGGPMLLISKTNAESTVHRRARMDYIGVKKLGEHGEVVGERRFLGLFTSQAYAEHADAIPILRDKLEAILESSEALPGSHDYKEIITIFNSMPKEELFRASVADLEPDVETILRLHFADDAHVSFRADPTGRGVSVMVILPRGKFSGEVRQRVREVLTSRFGGTVLNYHAAMGSDDQTRLHFYLSSPTRLEPVDADEIEAEIREIVRSWDDRLLNALAADVGHDEAKRLASLYGAAFSDEYKAATPPDVAVPDLVEIEAMRRDGRDVAIALREPRTREEEFAGGTVLNLYLAGARLILSDFMPTLDNAGLRVVEVTPFAVAGPGLPEVMIYSFAVRQPDGSAVPLERAENLSECLLAVRAGDATDDAFNALVLAADLRWRQADILRAYVYYAFQIGAVPTRGGPARALARYPGIARLLVDLFHARFDPARQDAELGAEGRDLDPERRPVTTGPHMRILGALDGVETLADDRALRSLLGLIEGTTRTNYFRHGAADPSVRSGGVPYVSLKFRCADIPELRRNNLLYEVFVHSSRTEGVHLRAAPVARGGIRWSDRPDDFRTEIMGLVQTQIVKNAVIIPSGSKGGFIIRRTFPDRESLMNEVAEQYRTLMRGLLDITDNLVAGRVVPPEDIVRHDGDDPYLVVAADKGTAHLSDVANAVAAEYDYWLGDAFASGGSHGYDHKEEGITARGAWECVKRHFRELGKDIQTEEFTVAGIGDMSGDVFGNGMLRSRQIRLIAAFDHRNVFIDPDPDAAASFAERERLFHLPRSSWEDYDRAVLSEGAMIVSRTSKEVEITPEARRALAIDESVERLDGEALVRAVLCAPVELLWNGGIGTYVKDSEESDSDVGDAGNDPVRVNADELRCKVVGEGGNLGFTQKARISYALAGGRIDTDALDNSAGVDMSDHEVNLKILLNPAVAAGEMDVTSRNALLASMTDEVSSLVLHDNISQSLAVSLDELRSREVLGDFASVITAFEREKLLDRAAEGIPDDEELARRGTEGLGLTRPTLCVLLAYAKLHAGTSLLASGLPDDAATQSYLAEYFPPEAVAAVGPTRLQEHRLRREIVTTCLINDLVDLMGATFLHRVSRETGHDVSRVARAWHVASRISGAAELRADLALLEGVHPVETLYRWVSGLARVLERTTRWVLNNVDPGASLTAVIGEHIEGLARLRGEFHQLVAGEDRAIFLDRMAELKDLGIEGPLAARLVTLRFLPALLDILRVAREVSADAVDTGRAYYLISERLDTAWLERGVRTASAEAEWEMRLGQQLLADIGRAHRAVARAVLESRTADDDLSACLSSFENARLRESALYRELLDELREKEPASLAAYAVAVRALADLARGR